MAGLRLLPGTEQLLISGGDARIALDPVNGLNKYGCQPLPDPELLAFGSSTATTISQAGFAAADQLRERLLSESGTDNAVYAREMQRIRLALLSDLSDPDVKLVFATSGTNAHFIAARHVASAGPLTVVMVEESETGSGVLSALKSDGAAEISMVALRGMDGAPRPAEAIDLQITQLVNKAVAAGRHVLLVMVDQSKTGMIAPGPVCATALHRQHSDQVAVLVDACQFRIAIPTMRSYLQQGFMVALTGSKFLTGPSFSAALLMPRGLRVMTDDDTGVANFGLLLRWEAALVELRRFRAVPQDTIIHYLDEFARAIQHRLKTDAHFESLAVPQLDRHAVSQSWDHIQTIFPFVLYRTTPAHRVPLSRNETLLVYRQLQASGNAEAGAALLRCQFGQPVVCGMREGIEVSALRLCISARLISDAYEKNGIGEVIIDAMYALDKAVRLVERLNDGTTRRVFKD